jgi:hypothetical protein
MEERHAYGVEEGDIGACFLLFDFMLQIIHWKRLSAADSPEVPTLDMVGDDRLGCHRVI